MTDINDTSSQLKPFRRIGMGHCGSVWADPDNTFRNLDLALKREDCGPGRSVKNEVKMHLRVLLSLTTLKAQGRCFSRWSVPFHHDLIRAHDKDKWSVLLPRLPSGYTACNALVSERIPPIRKDFRQVLIDKYCPEACRDAVIIDPNNEDCIVRAYLGRRRMQPARPSRFSAFSLRNYPLHVDQMEELDLDTGAYASAMAEALAFMHWCARIDANDVEFVLASRRQTAQGPAPFAAGQLGEHALWVLDFDCCQPLVLDISGVDRAVVGFYRNDPYYPLPGRSGDADVRLWEIFCTTYLAASHDFLKRETKETCSLPQLFIEQAIARSGEFRKRPEA